MGDRADDVTAAVGDLGTSVLSDALDRLGLAGTMLGIAPLRRAWRMSGRAFTVRYRAARGWAAGTVGDYIDDVPPGGVVLLENGGRTDCTVWGSILTDVAVRRALAGTVIDGVCRDTNEALELDYPLFTRGVYMRTGKDRVEVAAVEEPLTIGGAQVQPGDLVVGDGDGVVVIPRREEAAVLETAREVEATEQRIREAVAEGASLREARAEFGYHTLQREARG